MSRSTSFPSHAQLVLIRLDAQLRKQALATFGPQGVLDLAVLGAILGNNIREIGRYKVTCDGRLVQGRYTIYELVHFGALAVTCRQRESTSTTTCTTTTTTTTTKRIANVFAAGQQPQLQQRRSSTTSEHSTTDYSSNNNNSSSSGGVVPLIYPTTLSNLFPAMVFKALRRSSVRPLKFQHDDSNENHHSSCTTPPSTTARSSFESMMDTTVHAPRASSESTTTPPVDPMLITEESVLSSLVQQRLYRVKDLPLPQELCFLGAVSLPLTPVLRAMHVAWTMDFLNNRVTSPRRKRRQLQSSSSSSTVDNPPTGGLEFRPEVYAHKMRVARLARAQQQQQQQKSVARAGGSGAHTPSSTAILEENEDEDAETENGVKPTTTTTTTTLTAPSAAAIATNKSIRQDRRLVQHVLTLENRVPRAMRQWAAAARSCFADELIQEDRQVQEWIERQHIQVVLGGSAGSHVIYPRLGAAFAASCSTAAVAASAAATVDATTCSSASTSSTLSVPIPSGGAAGVRGTSGGHGVIVGTGLKHRRPTLSPISTTLANSIAFGHNHHSSLGNGGPLVGAGSISPRHLQPHRCTPPSPLSTVMSFSTQDVSADVPMLTPTPALLSPRPQLRSPSQQQQQQQQPLLSGTQAGFLEGFRLEMTPRAAPSPPTAATTSAAVAATAAAAVAEVAAIAATTASVLPATTTSTSTAAAATATAATAMGIAPIRRTVSDSNAVMTRPPSAHVSDRLSASQQMLSMHLWLSLLVSPLSPEQMAQDRFGFMDS